MKKTVNLRITTDVYRGCRRPSPASSSVRRRGREWRFCPTHPATTVAKGAAKEGSMRQKVTKRGTTRQKVAKGGKKRHIEAKGDKKRHVEAKGGKRWQKVAKRGTMRRNGSDPKD